MWRAALLVHLCHTNRKHLPDELPVLPVLFLRSEPELSGLAGPKEELRSALPGPGPVVHPAAVPGPGPEGQSDGPQGRESGEAHPDAWSTRWAELETQEVLPVGHTQKVLHVGHTQKVLPEGHTQKVLPVGQAQKDLPVGHGQKVL